MTASVQRAIELSHLVRAAALRVRSNKRHMPERRGEWYASIRALMAQVPGGGWR